MKVAVVGDTHMPRFGRALPAALARGLRAERVELIVHVGDFTGPEIPALFEAIAPLDGVAGNNDPRALVTRFGRRKILDVAGIRIGVIHGDGMGGTTVSRSVAAFAGDTVGAICFGHSHQPLCERDERRVARESGIADGQAAPTPLLLRDPGHRARPRHRAARVLRRQATGLARSGGGAPDGRVAARPTAT